MNVKKIKSTRNRGLTLPIQFTQTNSDSDLESDLKRYDQEILNYVINPEKDYEVIRFRHQPDANGDETITMNVTFNGGGYREIGFEQQELLNFSNAVKNSFFKFDYYDSNDQNKKKKFTKIIPITLSRDEETEPLNNVSASTNVSTQVTPLEQRSLIRYLSYVTDDFVTEEVVGSRTNPQLFYLKPQINPNTFEIKFYDVLEGQVGFNEEPYTVSEFCKESTPFKMYVKNVVFTITNDDTSEEYFRGVSNGITELNSDGNVFEYANIPLTPENDLNNVYDATDNMVLLNVAGNFTMNVSYEYVFNNAPIDDKNTIIENRFHQRDSFFSFFPIVYDSSSGVTSTPFDYSAVLGDDTPEISTNYVNSTFSYTTNVDTAAVSGFNVNDKVSFSIMPNTVSYSYFTSKFKNFSDTPATFTYVDDNEITQTVTLAPNEETVDLCTRAFVRQTGEWYYHIDLEGKVVNINSAYRAYLYNVSTSTIVPEEFNLTSYDFTVRTIKPTITSNRYKDSELYNLYYFNEQVDDITTFYVNCRFFNGKNGEVLPLKIEDEDFITCELNRTNKTYKYIKDGNHLNILNMTYNAT